MKIVLISMGYALSLKIDADLFRIQLNLLSTNVLIFAIKRTLK